MRIVSGIYGGRRFKLPTTFRARPTTDFAKENIFNVLRSLIDLEDKDGLDLFAGSGSITFELLSRGCRRVTAVEKDSRHASFIADVAIKLHTEALRLVRGDVFRFLEAIDDSCYDFIFADPPYDLPEIGEIPRLVVEKNILKNGGVFVMEHSKASDFSSLRLFRQRREYGSVNFSIFVN
jgi:16S rRNA (guanine(966)-N(2))-methyltransferase RsmD